MKDDQTHYWWKKKDDEVFESVFGYIRHLQNEQSYRTEKNYENMRLYGPLNLMGLLSYHYASNDLTNQRTNRVTFNIVQSMVDTAVSKITKNKPKAQFLTQAGNFSEQQRAKKLSKFVEGQFHCTNFYDISNRAFMESAIFGTGAVKIFQGGTKENPEIKAERVFIDEIVVDDTEAYYGKPRQMHQKKYIHRDVLKEMFPQHEGAISTVRFDTSLATFGGLSPRDTDMILVIESWHLPSGPKAKDGKRCISIGNKTLLCEEYDKDYFPFVFHRWGLRPMGFFGQGIAEQLKGIQLEINKILRTIQVSMHLVSVPKIFIENSSNIVSSHLDNKIGGIIKFNGNPPIPGQLGQIPSELFDHLDRLYTRAFEIVGISQLSAQSQKPSGLDSGKALREFNDIETERFMSIGMRYQNFFLDAAKMFIDIAKDIDESMDDEENDFSVNVKGKGFFETIRWKDINLADEKYEMQLFPVSSLSSTPAGKLQDVQELLQAGFISKEDGLKLLDFPDLEAANNLINAPSLDIDAAIENMIDKGQYETPEPYQNLQLGINKMQQAYLHYRRENAPESRLELLRRWIEDANDLILKSQTPPEPPLEPPVALDGAVPPEGDPLAAEAPVDPALAEAPVAPEVPVE